MAASPRRPLPDSSDGLPSVLNSFIVAPPDECVYRIRPSAPTPQWRSQSFRAQAGQSGAAIASAGT